MTNKSKFFKFIPNIIWHGL